MQWRLSLTLMMAPCHFQMNSGCVLARSEGAVEVKKTDDDLEQDLEQAKREAFALWCYNAVQPEPCYNPVWVVLTNQKQVMRVTYIGQNCPGGEGKGYKKRMRCADVKGQFEVAHCYTLFNKVEGEWCCGPMMDKAQETFTGGLIGETTPSLADLTRNIKSSSCSCYSKRSKSMHEAYMASVEQEQKRQKT